MDFPGSRYALGHRPALDGLRGVAILLVLLCHIPRLPFGGGFIGVDLFFVLSGFLITSLLLEEWRKTGTVSLRAFYARRALRLFPALFAMLIAAVAISAGTESDEAAAGMRRSALMTLFYSANWFLAYGAYPREEIRPTWSLSIEEQFYVLWPLLLLLLLRLGWSARRMALFAALGVLASALARAIWWETTRSFSRVYFGLDTHSDGLLAGALAAFLAHGGTPPDSPRAARLLNLFSLGMVGGLLLFATLGWPADPETLCRGTYLFLNLGMAALVLCIATSPSTGLRRLFELAPLVWFGKLSYGLYLWHLIAFWIVPRSQILPAEVRWPAAFGASVLLAAASYYLLERPFLTLKKRFARL